MDTKRILQTFVPLFLLIAWPSSSAAEIVLSNAPIVVKEPAEINDPTWIVAAATVVTAIATVLAAVAATVYAAITYRLLSEQRRSWIDDKFPCIVVRSRLGPAATPIPEENEWTIRLVNIGRGPAFIVYFHTMGLSDGSCADGDHTGDIDKVIGPDNGDAHLQVAFAQGHPQVLRRSEVTVIIRYHDFIGRVFTSGIRNGQPFYQPPWQNGHGPAET